MATRATKTSTVKTKSAKSEQAKTSAPKVARARKVKAGDSVAPAYDVIAERAFVRFCARGGEHGHDVEDWLAAEAELRHG